MASFITCFQNHSLIISWLGIITVVGTTLLFLTIAAIRKGWLRPSLSDNQSRLINDDGLINKIYLVYSIGFALLVFGQLAHSNKKQKEKLETPPAQQEQVEQMTE